MCNSYLLLFSYSSSCSVVTLLLKSAQNFHCLINVTVTAGENLES